MDLSPFLGAYRADGHGRPAYDPSMMVALLLYAYAKGNRSSRGIERECREDVAYRVICANLAPDHSTIAEFRKRHEAALAELFSSVLSLCKEAGLVKVGVIAIDGTKIAANASLDANAGYERIVREILDEAEENDRIEDELYGDARGDELPEQLHTPEGRRAALREAKLKLDGKRETSGQAREESGSRPGRATTRRQRSVKTRSSSRPRSQSTRPTSVTSSQWSRQLSRNWASLEPIHPRLSSPTPATGTRGRWRTSWLAPSRC